MHLIVCVFMAHSTRIIAACVRTEHRRCYFRSIRSPIAWEQNVIVSLKCEGGMLSARYGCRVGNQYQEFYDWFPGITHQYGFLTKKNAHKREWNVTHRRLCNMCGLRWGEWQSTTTTTTRTTTTTSTTTMDKGPKPMRKISKRQYIVVCPWIRLNYHPSTHSLHHPFLWPMCMLFPFFSSVLVASFHSLSQFLYTNPIQQMFSRTFSIWYTQTFVGSMFQL